MFTVNSSQNNSVGVKLALVFVFLFIQIRLNHASIDWNVKLLMLKLSCKREKLANKINLFDWANLNWNACKIERLEKS